MFLLSYYIILRLFVGLNYCRKYSRNWTIIYGDYLCDKRKSETKGRPGGTPRGLGQQMAAATPGPVGGTRPYPLGTASAPLDAYKITKTLKHSGR